MQNNNTALNLHWFLEQAAMGNVTLTTVKTYRGFHTISKPDYIKEPIFQNFIGCNFMYSVKTLTGPLSVILCPGIMFYMFDCFFLPHHTQPNTLQALGAGGVVDHDDIFEGCYQLITNQSGRKREIFVQLLGYQNYISFNNSHQNLIGFFTLDRQFLSGVSAIVMNNKSYDLVALFQLICEKLPELYFFNVYNPNVRIWEEYVLSLKKQMPIRPNEHNQYSKTLELIQEKQEQLKQMIPQMNQKDFCIIKEVPLPKYEITEKQIEFAADWWAENLQEEFFQPKENMILSQRSPIIAKSKSNLKDQFKEKLSHILITYNNRNNNCNKQDIILSHVIRTTDGIFFDALAECGIDFKNFDINDRMKMFEKTANMTIQTDGIIEVAYSLQEKEVIYQETREFSI